MTTTKFIAGDWGTTNLRLVLIDGTSSVLDTATGPGVAQVRSGFETVLGELTRNWEEKHGRLPTILCGMVGSTIGWLNVPYLPCPAPPERIADAMVCAGEKQALIAPGLSCRNRLGAPDVMRGEETQVLGALRLMPALQQGRHLLCLPGTHAKWVVLNDGVVEEFLTSVTGELFALLNEHSVLVRADAATGFSATAFDAGVQRIRDQPRAAIVHLLFECRSRQVMGELPRADAADFLSGLLIGHDLAGAAELFADIRGKDGALTIIAAPGLAQRYARVCGALGIPATTVDGAHASLSGLTHLYDIRFARGKSDAA